MKHIFEVKITVVVETELSPEEAQNEFESECDYEFPSTDKVRVLDTTWEETTIK